jgi:hypothetical protein
MPREQNRRADPRASSASLCEGRAGTPVSPRTARQSSQRARFRIRQDDSDRLVILLEEALTRSLRTPPARVGDLGAVQLRLIHRLQFICHLPVPHPECADRAPFARKRPMWRAAHQALAASALAPNDVRARHGRLRDAAVPPCLQFEQLPFSAIAIVNVMRSRPLQHRICEVL